MSFSVCFLNGYSMDIVVGAERYDFEVRCYVVDDASSDSVDVKVVGVHECHAT